MRQEDKPGERLCQVTMRADVFLAEIGATSYVYT